MFDLVTMRKYVQWFTSLFGVSTCIENCWLLDVVGDVGKNQQQEGSRVVAILV